MKNVLHKWVEECGGADQAGKKLGVGGHAVRKWLRKENGLKPRTILAIIKLSKNKYDFASLVAATLPRRK